MPQGQVPTTPDDGRTTRQRRHSPLVVVHHGAGKGKSTAAFGLALRGWNQGWSTAVFQFVKSAKWRIGEEQALTTLGRVHEQTGEGGPVEWHKMGSGWSWSRKAGTEEDHARDAREGWAEIQRRLAAEQHQMYVLDEFSYVLKWGWVDVAEVVETLQQRPGYQHVVITGRDPHPDLLAIADGFKKMGLDPRESSLKTAVLGAEPWTEEMRREIEQTFDLDALDIYGLSEVMGPGVAGESAATKDGSHIWEDHFRPEIIDPLTDEVLETGRHGELVFTSLTKQALPIIRYRTHDLTRLLPGTTHPGHRRMGRITGRSDDMIILRGVNLFPSQIEELALKEPALSPHFTLEITRPDRMDQMAVNIERRDHATLEEAQACAAHLRMEIKTKIGSSCVINVVEPESLARSSGKLKRIYDLRDQA